MTGLDDPALVRREYATEAGLLGRSSAYRDATGPDPRAIAIAAVAEVQAASVLDAGCGPGVLAERLVCELGVEVTALDQSERMVEVTLRELYELLGLPREKSSFSAENGEGLLRAVFAKVQRRDAMGWIEFPDRAAAQSYVDASAVFTRGPPLPPTEGPLRVRRGPVVFVADA